MLFYKIILLLLILLSDTFHINIIRTLLDAFKNLAHDEKNIVTKNLNQRSFFNWLFTLLHLSYNLCN